MNDAKQIVQAARIREGDVLIVKVTGNGKVYDEFAEQLAYELAELGLTSRSCIVRDDRGSVEMTVVEPKEMRCAAGFPHRMHVYRWLGDNYKCDGRKP